MIDLMQALHDHLKQRLESESVSIDILWRLQVTPGKLQNQIEVGNECYLQVLKQVNLNVYIREQTLVIVQNNAFHSYPTMLICLHDPHLLSKLEQALMAPVAIGRYPHETIIKW
jgi:hypothetical protein